MSTRASESQHRWRRGTPAPQRIVSLVPSITESLFALGLGERVVGVTEWCVHPADGVAPLPKLGGTKNPDLDGVADLRPDLVIANREENTRRALEHLEAAGLSVWVTYPRTAREGAVTTSSAWAVWAAAPEVANGQIGKVTPVSSSDTFQSRS